MSVCTETRQTAYLAEHHRLQGEIHIARGEDGAADAAYQRGVAIARSQGARWLELRAARGYARFLSARDRAADARAVLAPVVASIAEGRATLDYASAESLLRTL